MPLKCTARKLRMPDFLHLSKNERKEILQTAATKLGQQAAVLEKDVWVCWALQALFSIPDAHPMAFKGGTSLSKVYKAINRFSEDVDVTLDYRSFKDDCDPFSESTSKSAIKKYSKRLKGYVLQYTNETVAPYLADLIKTAPFHADCNIKVSDDGEKIWIEYPSAVEESNYYLQSSILIELGGRNVVDPNEKHIITPDIAPLVTELDLPSAQATVLSPERTFWEKATLIHVACNRENIKENASRLSRHWYDITMLAKHPSGKAAINNHELFNDVIQHKRVFFNASYADYDACQAGNLRLIPNDDVTNELKKDYEKMLSAGMIYDEPPSFDEIMTNISIVEKAINNW